MAWTTKLLVIANRTVGSEQLRQTLLARAQEGPIAVTLVAPAAGGVAAERLEETVARLRADGLQVEGILGDADPMVAVSEAWDPRRFDEVIVSTLPGGASRWLAYDLPHRIARLTDARVTHIVSDAPEPVS